MIPVYTYPASSEWESLAGRPEPSGADITARVEQILQSVREGGDAALCRLISEIEGRPCFLPADETILSVTPSEANQSGSPPPTEPAAQFRHCKEPKATKQSTLYNFLEVTEPEFAAAERDTPDEVKQAIAKAARNIRLFHEAQRTPPVEVETMPGVRCVQRSLPIRRVGLYVPGGTAPLFSTVLMLAIPARTAGCPEVVMCTPADKTGRIAAPILYAARFCGVDRVFKVGGAQAIAAMAYGTESIPRVDKIFGPGNGWVTRAKQLVGTADCAVDMPAGPSEVLVMADGSARVDFVAADLLSQAEHGADSQAVLVCDNAEFAAETSREIQRRLASLPRREIAARSLQHSRIVVLRTRGEMIDFANLYAAEHLIIQMTDPWQVAEKITAAGSIFIGGFSPESAGDYASGTNHTLPTSGWARALGGLNLDSFTRKITLQELSREGLQSLADTITAMAEAEGLAAHAAAVKIRLQK